MSERATCLVSPTSSRSSYCGSTRNPVAPMSPDTCRNCLAAMRADDEAAELRREGKR